MDERLHSLGRLLESPSDADRIAQFAEFVDELIEDIQSTIECHKDWWLNDGESVPHDIEVTVLMDCVRHFFKAKNLEKLIAEDNRELGLQRATWPPYLSANVHPLVQRESRRYFATAELSFPPSGSSETPSSPLSLDDIQAYLGLLDDSPESPIESSPTNCTTAATSTSTSTRYNGTSAGISFPDFSNYADFSHLFTTLVKGMNKRGTNPHDAEDLTADRLMKVLMNPDVGTVSNLGGFVAHALRNFDLPDYVERLKKKPETLPNDVVRFPTKATTEAEDEVFARELRTAFLDYVSEIPAEDREILVAAVCDRFIPQQISEKLYYRMQVLKTSRNVSNMLIDRRKRMETVLAKHGYDAPPKENRNVQGTPQDVPTSQP